ncbi:MAG: prephenate dehydratase [Hyphomicrobiaceae bacterium]|nr:prephenate dehydratase [Hyphomicrobiaceae bacterium]
MSSQKAKPASGKARSSKGRISYQGERGANSEIACGEVFPSMEPVPCAAFEDALAAVKGGDCDLAMIPIENSLAGRVADIHHMLPASGLHIIGEHFLPIRFQLMALKGVKLKQITDVYSHVHALGQCRKIIRKLGLKPHVAGDTAGAARQVSEWKDPTKAAFAPRLAAEVYHLDILAEDVEDEKHNTTRFVVLSRDQVNAKRGNGPIMTTFVFRVRNIPAALYKAMGGFATNGVNMTKLESYMVGGQFTATMFLADIEGHPDDLPVKRALEELEYFSDELRVLGVYPASPLRAKLQGG